MKTARRAMTLVFSSLLLLAACSSEPPLDMGTGSGGVCQRSIGAEFWKTRQVKPTEFGLGYVHQGGDGPIRIDSAEMIDGQGLRLTDVAFVRGGGVGSGGIYGDTNYAASAASWAGRISMPGAVLGPSRVDPNASDDWQMVVGVLPIGDGGSAKGLELDYHVGSTEFQAKGRWGFALVRDESNCPSFGAPPSDSPVKQGPKTA